MLMLSLLELEICWSGLKPLGFLLTSVGDLLGKYGLGNNIRGIK